MVDDIPKIQPDKPKPELSPTGQQAIAKAEAELKAVNIKSLPSPSPSPSTVKSAGFKKPFSKWFKIFLIILSFWVVMAILIAIPAAKTLQAAQTTIALARETYTAGKNQNLPEFNTKLEATKQQLQRTHQIYQILAWTKLIPFVGVYYSEGHHAFKAAIAGTEAAQILGQTLEPYADVLGFQGQGTFTGGTAEDRITKIVETLDKVIPEIDRIAEKVQLANQEIHQINPNHYPANLKGSNLKQTIITAQTFADDALIAVTDAKPVIAILPQALGIEEEKKYLVLFQNDAEIRATGGFMTAYGILRIDKGKVYQEKSDDIYNLDAKFNKHLKPPELIDKYLPLVFYWNLRDMNLSPDFKESMNTFYSYYQDIPGEPEVDGIIAVDTQVLNDLVSILGPIEVPGFGTFTSDTDPRCNCPQVIYELEDMATRPVAYVKTERKGFLAPMMQTLLLKAYGSPKNQWPGLFQTILRNINEKHVLFYLLEENQQTAIEGVNIAGRIQACETDYFHLNDLNFAGAKSNMFITEAVNQEITLDKGTVTKKVTITYKNPQPSSNCNLEAGELCLNGVLRDIVRLYVPQGSELKEALGFEEDTVENYQELDKTVFQGFFTLNPQSQAKVVFEYTTPYTPSNNQYQMLIQKQPGKKRPHYTITINQEYQQEFDLASDTEVTVKLK